jgi:hypothetical protein
MTSWTKVPVNPDDAPFSDQRGTILTLSTPE